MEVNGYEIKPNADLRGADLRGADLREADLREAALWGANLRGADLREADLREAALWGANLREANLSGADLRGANLKGANLREANLKGANLREADLRGADLRGADLREADLRGADLWGANLREADLRGADLRGANLQDTCLDLDAPIQPLQKEILERCGLELEGKYVWGWRTRVSKFCGNTTYIPGECYTAPWFSVDTETECHPGIYLAGLAYMYAVYPAVPLVRCFCRHDELIKAGDKFRCKRLWIVGKGYSRCTS
jgi:hypothetical protein